MDMNPLWDCWPVIVSGDLPVEFVELSLVCCQQLSETAHVEPTVERYASHVVASTRAFKEINYI
jgi:hypothetical protein